MSYFIPVDVVASRVDVVYHFYVIHSDEVAAQLPPPYPSGEKAIGIKVTNPASKEKSRKI